MCKQGTERQLTQQHTHNNHKIAFTSSCSVRSYSGKPDSIETRTYLADDRILLCFIESRQKVVERCMGFMCVDGE